MGPVLHAFEWDGEGAQSLHASGSKRRRSIPSRFISTSHSLLASLPSNRGKLSSMVAMSSRQAEEAPRYAVDDVLISTLDLDEHELTEALGRSRNAGGSDGTDGIYEIRRILGSGGMGTVYLAHDSQLERDVAVKMIRSDKLSEPEALDRFTAEARAMARVHHPNVVTIHAFGSRDGQPYLVMEYVPGVNLATWRQQRGMVSPVEAVAVLDALCRGVQAIHDVGAIHRDLKPANVLIGPGQRVAVTDFGLARPLTYEELRDRMALEGTPAYLAPEISRFGPLMPELATRIDIYALGVMAFELLTGRSPFTGPGLIALLDKHAFEPPPRPSEVCPTLSPAFDAPLLQALAKSPSDRQATADGLRVQLLEALEASTQPRPLRVLMADDDAGALLAMRELLQMSFPDAHVVAVTDPVAALSIARRERPDLVITDLHMPQGGGRALTAALRRDPVTKDVPIVVVTAVGGGSDWQTLRELGADRFLVKPVDIDILVGMVRSLTSRRGEM
jgi:serine/threonine protein kinase